MPVPEVSIVVPAYNEAREIAGCIARWRAYLDETALTWEIVVVDDGSTDATADVVRELAASESRLRLVAAPHRGKGAAVRSGMIAARGRWRFMADADSSMAPEDLNRFLAVVEAPGEPRIDVAIGSREAAGAYRIGESWQRHVIGRIFNRLVQWLAVPGIADTQCGFKLLSAAAAERLFPCVTIDGFAFDVELLFLARRAGLTVREVGIEWRGRADSRVSLTRGATAFADILRVRWNGWIGRYDTLAPTHTRALADER